MTYRELINQVLIRLREDTISSDWSGAINDSTTVSAYQKTIGALINDSNRNYINTVKYPTDDTGEPIYYAFNGSDSSNNLKIDLSPVPTEAHTLSFDIVKPQSELTLAATVLKIPSKPVILGAWARAISERGEDGGTQSSLMAQETGEALKQAIILDSGNVQYETDWYVNENYSYGTVNFR